MDYSFYAYRYERVLFLLPRGRRISGQLVDLKLEGRNIEWEKFGGQVRGMRPDAIVIDQVQLEEFLNPRSSAEAHKNKNWWHSDLKPMSHRADIIFTKKENNGY